MNKFNTWVDTKMMMSVAAGILLAAVIGWAIGGVLMALGLGHRGGWDKDRMQKKMQNMDMMQGGTQMMQGDMNNSMYVDPAGTFEAGIDVPTGTDAAAM